MAGDAQPARTGHLHAGHPGWVAFSQVWIRLATALKFFLVSRELGPSQVGIFAIGLLVLTVVEAATESGLQAALIQRQEPPTADLLGAAWSALLTRGVVLAAAIVLSAPFTAAALGDPSAVTVIQVMGLVSLFRSAQHLGLTCLRRERDFRTVGLIDSAAITLDLATALLLARLGAGALAMAGSAAAGEALRTALSWAFSRHHQHVSVHWRLLQHVSRFGAWIWGSSMLTLLVNQIDKAIISRQLGVGALGIYQVSTRVSQLLIADIAVALTQYLFPTLSHLHRTDPAKARRMFLRTLLVISVAALGVAAAVFVGSASITHLLLGERWTDARTIVGYAAWPMALGAPTAVLVPYLRAIGKPGLVTQATLLQLGVLSVAALSLVGPYGIIGMITANTLALLCSTGFMAAHALIPPRT